MSEKLRCFKDLLKKKKNKLKIGSLKVIPLISITEMYESIATHLESNLVAKQNELKSWAEKVKSTPSTPEFAPLRNQINQGFYAAEKAVTEIEANLSLLFSTGRGLPKVNP